MTDPATFVVPVGKIADYLLDETHRDGGAKARFFVRFGFRRADPLGLATALLEQAAPRNFVREGRTPRGNVKLVYEGAIVSPDGRNPRVRTVWQIRSGTIAELVTAVPLTG